MQAYCTQLFATEGRSPFQLHPTSPRRSRSARSVHWRETDEEIIEVVVTPATYARAMHKWTADQLCAATCSMMRNSSSGMPLTPEKATSPGTSLAERRLDASMAKLTLEPDPRARPGRLFSDYPRKNPGRSGGKGLPVVERKPASVR